VAGTSGSTECLHLHSTAGAACMHVGTPPGANRSDPQTRCTLLAPGLWTRPGEPHSTLCSAPAAACRLQQGVKGEGVAATHLPLRIRFAAAAGRAGTAVRVLGAAHCGAKLHDRLKRGQAVEVWCCAQGLRCAQLNGRLGGHRGEAWVEA